MLYNYIFLLDFCAIENEVNDIINQGIDIELSTITVQDLLSNNEVYVPSYVDPHHSKIQLIVFNYRGKTFRYM